MNRPCPSPLVSSFRRIPILVALVAFALALRLQGQDADCVGYVFESQGDWQENGAKVKFRRGYPLKANGVIAIDPDYLKAHPGTGKVTVRLLNGTSLERSAAGGDLSKPLQLPAALAEQSTLFGRITREMRNIFPRNGQKYVMMSVRADMLHLHEAVVSLKDGAVDLAPLFEGAPPGNYRLRFQRDEKDPEAVPPPVPQPFVFDWQPEQVKPVAIANLSPGFWRISVLHSRRDEELGPDTWVLICRPETFPDRFEMFASVLKVTESWGPKASKADVRTFWRIALAAIAKTPPP